MKLVSCVHHFFEQYLPRIKGYGPNTINGVINLLFPKMQVAAV